MTTAGSHGYSTFPAHLSARATGVRFDGDRLLIQLEDGREISAPLSWFPRLEYATPAERADWRLIGQGQGIHWEQVDEDISPTLLLGLPCE